jgi:hypothetical protein
MIRAKLIHRSVRYVVILGGILRESSPEDTHLSRLQEKAGCRCNPEA